MRKIKIALIATILIFTVSGCAGNSSHGKTKLYDSCVILHGEGIQCDRYKGS